MQLLPFGIGASQPTDLAGGRIRKFPSGKQTGGAPQHPLRSGQNIVFGLLKNRSWRRATTWLLAVMQLHLLVVLVLHHHVLPGILRGFSQTTTSVGQTHRQSQPAGAEQGYCTACQILRHSAVRPSLGNPTPHRSSVAPFLATLSATVALSTQPAPWHGRAPPLA
jgi:hypothetical protein